MDKQLGFKELTANEYQAAQADAEKFVINELGNEPVRKNYERENDNILQDPQVFLTIPIFITALAINSFELFKFIGEEITRILLDSVPYDYGTQINGDYMALTFQWGGLLLAEFTIIVMIMRWRTNTRAYIEKAGKKDRKKKRDHAFYYLRLSKTLLSFELILALMSMMLILYANWISNIFPLLAVMPPLVTIGLGIGYEELYAVWNSERKRVSKEYHHDLKSFQDIKRDPQSHQKFDNILRRALFTRIERKNKALNLNLLSGSDKWLIVQDAIKNFNWVDYEVLKTKASSGTGKAAEDLTDAEVLREQVGVWNEGDESVITVGSYQVDMIGLTFRKPSGEIKQAVNTRGLRRMITTEVRKGSNG